MVTLVFQVVFDPISLYLQVTKTFIKYKFVLFVLLGLNVPVA